MTRRALLVAMIDVLSEDEDEFNSWYVDHAAERVACPGFLSCRRFVALEGEPKYLAIYELQGPEALETPEYKALRVNQSEQSRRLSSRRKRLIRNVYLEIETPDSPS
jgi:hypothetical protein